ncbi:MAG: hypothetical protein ACOC3V_02665 [bacterium]
MVKTIEYPTKNAVQYHSDGTVYLRSDNDTIDQYCSENDYTYISHEVEEQRFSNNGGLLYAYYGPFTYNNEDGDPVTEDRWQLEFGFKRVITKLTVEKT